MGDNLRSSTTSSSGGSSYDNGSCSTLNSYESDSSSNSRKNIAICKNNSNDTDSEGYQSGIEYVNQAINMDSTGAKIITPGPYRATRLWRSLIKNFTKDMPTKTHTTRLGLKNHDNTFTASEAIEFLNEYLVKNPNYGSSVTRDQTTMLLKKLLEQKIIIPINDSQTTFKEGKDLYKFSKTLPQYINSPISRCNITQNSVATPRKLFSSKPNNDSTLITPSSPSKKLQEHEVNQLKNLVISRIICSLGVRNLEDLGIDEYQISACDIYWNCVKVNKTGIVHSEKENQPKPPIRIFHYIKDLASFSHTKALYSRWSQDIFNKILEYYQSLCEPLLTFGYYELFSAILEMIDSADVTMQVGVGHQLHADVHEAFRLSLLLLPPNNRRRLHILLKLMSKILINQDLSILKPADETSLKMYLIKVFWPTIFRCPVEFACDLEEVLGIRFVSILLDQYENLLKPDWQHLMAQVRYLTDNNDENKHHKAVSSGHSTIISDTNFCQKISINEYEAQSKLSNNEMRLLLERILTDASSSKQDRRKRLKQFQVTYPSIYSERFPNTKDDPLIHESSKTAKGFLTKLF